MYLNFGKATTREPSTTTQYRKIYQSLEKKARKRYALGAEALVTPNQIASIFLQDQPSWAPATARLYRASLVFVYSEINNTDSMRALEMVHHVNKDQAIRLAIREDVEKRRKDFAKCLRSSSRRARNLSADEIDNIRRGFEFSSSKYAKVTCLWFFASILTGLRPSEWRTAQLSINAKGQPVLMVNSAKNKNDRMFGRRRTLELSKMSQSDLNLIRAHLATIEIYREPDSFCRLFSGCRHVMRNTVAKFWLKKNTYPSLYTARHVFSGNAKKEFDRASVAALMGHTSADAS